MTVGAGLFIAFLVVQRLSELIIARRNTRRLMERGAYEVAPKHYGLIVALHTAWLLSLAVFGLDETPQTGWLAAFACLFLLRIWIMASLGARWTTRIIVLDEPLVAKGPYRWIRHPNYALVVAEIAIAPLVLGLVWVAIVFSALNAAVLAIRIKAEDKALRAAHP